jgi:prolyl oligopeptidase
MNIRPCLQKPDTPRQPMVREKHGISVPDDYAWLEVADEKREAWLKDQITRTDCHLDNFPKHGEIKARLLELLEPEKAAGKDKGYVGKRHDCDGFQLQWLRDPGQRSFKIVRFESESDTDGKTVFDPNSWPEGETVAWSNYSRDLRYLAFGKRLQGKDKGQMTILDLKEQKSVFEADGLRTSQHAVWSKNGAELYFRGPSDKEWGLSVFDTKSNKARTISEKSTGAYGEIAEFQGNVLFTTNGEKYGEESLRFIDTNGSERTLDLGEGEMSFTQSGQNVFILTDTDAPNGQVLRADLAELSAGRTGLSQVIPNEPGRVIKSVQLHDDILSVNYDYYGQPGVVFYDSEGELQQDLRSDVPGVFTVGSVKDGLATLNWSSLIEQSVTKKLNLETGVVEVVKRTEVPGFDPKDFTVERKWCISKDGTPVPMTIAHKKDLELDGQNPTHIYVYGGFNNSVYTGYKASAVPFLEAGGVYAIAHARGGNELGQEWHEQAMSLNRDRVYDDVAAAAKFLSQEGYATPETTSIEGGSNGGLVTGVAITRDSELFDAAVADVGLYDMFRYESLGGSSWSEEYGSVEDPMEAVNLLSWSPYHNVKEGKEYPAVMITTGKNDDRVNPVHSYKFAAQLQNVETTEHPVYLRVDENLGHGAGATPEETADRYADQWAFLLSELTDGD